LPILVGGAVIMENIFNLPGLGRLLLDARSGSGNLNRGISGIAA
jgi:ABC-type dipeptide/oligopeptide/nickel transport system permease component